MDIEINSRQIREYIECVMLAGKDIFYDRNLVSIYVYILLKVILQIINPISEGNIKISLTAHGSALY